jgi:hypothetical protein
VLKKITSPPTPLYLERGVQLPLYLERGVQLPLYLERGVQLPLYLERGVFMSLLTLKGQKSPSPNGEGLGGEVKNVIPHVINSK